MGRRWSSTARVAARHPPADPLHVIRTSGSLFRALHRLGKFMCLESRPNIHLGSALACMRAFHYFAAHVVGRPSAGTSPVGDLRLQMLDVRHRRGGMTGILFKYV